MPSVALCIIPDESPTDFLDIFEWFDSVRSHGHYSS